jgi:hypothetical protein
MDRGQVIRAGGSIFFGNEVIKREGTNFIYKDARVLLL